MFSVILSQVIGLEHREGESSNGGNMAFIIPLQLSFELCSKNFQKLTNIGLACSGKDQYCLQYMCMNSHIVFLLLKEDLRSDVMQR